MKKLIVLIFTLMFCSCATKSTTPEGKIRFPNVAPIVKPLVIKFNKYYKKYRHSSLQDSIIVKFQPIEDSERCQGVYHGDKDITVISSEHWGELSKLQKEIVLFHELGHHILKRGHQTFKPIMHNKCNRSMMHKNGVTDTCYEEGRRYYMRELFKRGK